MQKWNGFLEFLMLLRIANDSIKKKVIKQMVEYFLLILRQYYNKFDALKVYLGLHQWKGPISKTPKSITYSFSSIIYSPSDNWQFTVLQTSFTVMKMWLEIYYDRLCVKIVIWVAEKLNLRFSKISKCWKISRLNMDSTRCRFSTPEMNFWK